MADIFGKIVGGLNKGVATVGANSKAMVEKAQIKTVMNNLESECKQLCELLGRKVYDQCSQSNEAIMDEDMANFVAEIGKRFVDIEEQKAELKRIDEELRKVKGAATSAPTTQNACACGHVCVQGSKFCAKCGMPQ